MGVFTHGSPAPWRENHDDDRTAADDRLQRDGLPAARRVAARAYYRTPETRARRAYRNLVYFHEVDKGGHFAAWEQPELFAAELRAAFRSVREGP